MTLLADAEAWASAGTDPLFDQYVKKPQEFTVREAQALLRAAYSLGYVDAFGGVDDDPPAPLPILRACQYSTALRLTLPLSSY